MASLNLLFPALRDAPAGKLEKFTLYSPYVFRESLLESFEEDLAIRFGAHKHVSRNFHKV